MDKTHIYRRDYRYSRTFASRSWWKKRWVIQELVFARSALVFCGVRSISWKDIVNFTGISVVAAFPFYYTVERLESLRGREPKLIEDV
jgi:hypothetical protein